MTWKAHADYVWKKVASRVSILGRVRSFVTKEAATLVHNALILPLFDYCDIAWSNLLQQDIDRLQRLQNRSARIITRCSRSSEAIEQLHWPTLSSRRSYHKAKLVFLCLHSLVPSYFSLYFTRFSNSYNYSTRQSMRLSLILLIPCHFLSLAISKNCFSWDRFNRFPALAGVTTFPSVVTHTGFRESSWSVMLSSWAYLTASFTSDWWPDAMACSSNSLTASTVWSEFWYNFSSDLILVILYSCSTDRRPLPPFSLGS